MSLAIDHNSRQVRQFTCQCCSTEANRTWAFVYEHETALAVYYASCYHRNDIHEVWIDAIVGTFWRIVDTIVEHDELVHPHLYGTATG